MLTSMKLTHISVFPVYSIIFKKTYNKVVVVVMSFLIPTTLDKYLQLVFWKFAARYKDSCGFFLLKVWFNWINVECSSKTIDMTSVVCGFSHVLPVSLLCIDIKIIMIGRWNVSVLIFYRNLYLRCYSSFLGKFTKVLSCLDSFFFCEHNESNI